VEGLRARAVLADGVRTAVDRRAIAARNLVLASDAKGVAIEKAEVERAHRDVTERLAKLQQMAGASDVSQRAADLIAEIARIERLYAPVALGIVELALNQQLAEATTKLNEECRPLLANLTKTAEEFSSYTEQQSKEMIQAAEEQFVRERNWVVLACLVAVLAAVAAGAYIVRSLGRSLGAEPGELSVIAQKVAQGDLSPMERSREAPAGSVLASLASMQESLAKIVQEVRQSADSIATGSTQIATGNADLSQRTEEQASALEQTAATMDELAATVRRNADSASQANKLAQGASSIAMQGGSVVNDVVGTMKEINTSSKKISEIIGVIDGIAFQTNILALNAAVEAARAGEQGRGFAVVAGEVRSLAQRSAQAARETKNLISSSVAQVDQGSALVERAGRTMEEVVTAIRQVSDIVAEISSASLEQSEGVAQVGEAVSQMDQVTQQNAALVEESAAAAESLRSQSQHLVKAVEVFTLGSYGASVPHPLGIRPANSPGRICNPLIWRAATRMQQTSSDAAATRQCGWPGAWAAAPTRS
jgi:methyl-accepting chemotaxis protein